MPRQDFPNVDETSKWQEEATSAAVGSPRQEEDARGKDGRL